MSASNDRLRVFGKNPVTKMNRAQRRCLWGGIIAIGLLGLYPPWVQTFFRAHMTRPVGYSFIFRPPSVQFGGVEIDGTRLLIEWFVVSLVTGLLVWQLGHRGKP